MRFFRHLSIKHKLMVIAMLVSGSALLMASTAFVLFEGALARKQMVDALDTTAAMTAANSTAGLSFDESASVGQALKSLSAQPDIVQACVYDREGKVFARYLRAGLVRRPPPPPVGVAGSRFDQERLRLFQPINLAGETIGTIYLEQDLRPLSRRLWNCILIGVLVWLASASLAFVLSSRLQKVISVPLSDLAKIMAAVRTNRNYSVRAVKPSEDELGHVIDGFNDMLAQIQERDHNLEQRVASRTQELEESLSVLNATLSSTAEGILVVNSQGKKIFQNRRAEELWQLPPHIAAGDDDGEQVRYLASVVADPARFLNAVAHYYSHPNESAQWETILTAGTILEVATAPVLDQAGRNYGRIWTFRDVTQSRKNEAALVESQARFKFIFESVPVGIASHLTHADGRLVWEINRAYLRLCGLTREQHEQPGIYARITHPEDYARQLALLQQVNEGKIQQYAMEKRLVRLDGSTVWVAFSFQRQKYSDGSCEELTTLVDITESKRGEAALRESEANFYSLVDQMPAGIFRKDQAGRYVFVNSWFCRNKGVKAETFLGRLPAEVPAGECGTGAAELFASGSRHHEQIMATGRQIETEEKCTLPDGRVAYHHAVKSPVYGPDGKVVGSQGILLDITQRKLAEAELAHERDLLMALLEQAPDAIFFKDRQSGYVRQSRSELMHLFRVALNRQPAGRDLPPHLTSLEAFQQYVVGKSDADIYGPEQAARYRHEEQAVIQSGQAILGKVEQVVGADGQPAWLLITKTPWHNSEGEIIGTLGTARNITDLKRAEAKAELAHQQLLETSRLAGMAEMATSVLHNVGNVLNNVNVSTTLVLDLVKKSRLNNLGRLAALIHEQRDQLAAFFTTDPRGRQLPAYLSQLVEHLAAEQAQLTTEIELTRSNIEHIRDIVTMQQSYAKVSGVVEQVKVVDLVEDALRMNGGALARHGVETVRDYPGEAVECHTERHKVLQILVNLIRNAKYACDESGRSDKRLRMGVRASAGRIQIIVQDNGVGIPAENLTRIFSHGFTTRQQGHGFGLHSGALAAKELGGSLTVFSDGPGTGARFVLDLPQQPDVMRDA